MTEPSQPDTDTSADDGAPISKSGAETITDEAFAQDGSGQPGSAADSAPQENTGKDSRAQHTSLQCLSLVARHHGVDVSADRLVHDYSLEDEEPSLNRVMRIAKDTGFKTRFVRLTWKHFEKVNEYRILNHHFCLVEQY